MGNTPDLVKIAWNAYAGGSVPERLIPWHDAMVDEELSEKTVRSRICRVDLVCRHSGLSDPRHLTAQHIKAYIHERGLQPASVIKYLEHISLWARFAEVDDPTESIRRPKPPKYRPRPLTPENYRRVMWPGVPGTRLSSDVAIAAARVGVRLTFHQFRHTAITRYYQKARDLVATQEFARHQSPETTAIYALADRGNHRKILNSLHQDDETPDDVASQPQTGQESDAELLGVLKRFGMGPDDLFRLLLGRRSGEIQDD
ncbi:tyrosine-type recombinase/integrase [Streptomyces sp. LHD-70]|uniref:tyrosine-type recombinase/integrase n=1 Tax=Streptomyces sp. LHD-70 TaxID=3072140 RepID=UPI002810356C|nr:tyrosine-type recombinase/integrase [Streptomyces sp. LHD-70]MDQ8708409.1 tyrosine-type recombinase/integrase [Streptomyces sp. LHD-70]